MSDYPYPAGKEMLDSFRLVGELRQELEARDKTIVGLQRAVQETALPYAQLCAVRAELATARADYKALIDESAEEDPGVDAMREQWYSESSRLEILRLEDELAEERAAHEATKRELARVTEDAIAKTQRLRMTESAYQQALEHLREVDEILGLYPSEGAPTYAADRLRWVLQNL